MARKVKYKWFSWQGMWKKKYTALVSLKKYIGKLKSSDFPPKEHGKILKYFKQKVTLAEPPLSPHSSH